MRVPTPRRRVHSKKRWTDPEEVDNGSSWHSVGPRWPRSWFFFRRKRISSPIATTSWIKDIRCATYVRSIRAFDRCWNLFPDILLVGSWIFYEASTGRENILFLVPVWFLRRMTPSTISISPCRRISSFPRHTRGRILRQQTNPWIVIRQFYRTCFVSYITYSIATRDGCDRTKES